MEKHEGEKEEDEEDEEEEEEEEAGPREARGHSRLCKPYRSAHYLAARRLSNNIMVQCQHGP